MIELKFDIAYRYRFNRTRKFCSPLMKLHPYGFRFWGGWAAQCLRINLWFRLLLIQKNKSIWIASNNYYRQGRYVLSERTSTAVLNKTPIFKIPHQIKYEVTTANNSRPTYSSWCKMLTLFQASLWQFKNTTVYLQ